MRELNLSRVLSTTSLRPANTTIFYPNSTALPQWNDSLMQRDWEILGFIASSGVGIIVSAISFILFLRVQSLRSMKPEMRLSARAVFASSFVFSSLIFLCRTDVVFPFDFSVEWVCSLTFGASWTFYAITKMATYLHFSYRIQCVLGDSEYRVSIRTLYRLRASMLLFGVPTLICAVSFLDKHEVHTPIRDIHLCTGSTSPSLDIGNVSIMVFLFFDFVISALMVFLYCSKLKEIMQMVAEMDCEAMKLKSLHNLRDQLNKSTVMVLTAILSTWTFFVVGNFFWWSLGWLIPLDVVINCLSICFIYNFADRYYKMCCLPCVFCCDSAKCIDALKVTRGGSAERQLAAYTASEQQQHQQSQRKLDARDPSVRSEAMHIHSPVSPQSNDLEDHTEIHNDNVPPIIPPIMTAPSFTSRDKDLSVAPTIITMTSTTRTMTTTTTRTNSDGEEDTAPPPTLLHMPSHFDRDRYFAEMVHLGIGGMGNVINRNPNTVPISVDSGPAVKSKENVEEEIVITVEDVEVEPEREQKVVSFQTDRNNEDMDNQQMME